MSNQKLVFGWTTPLRQTCCHDVRLDYICLVLHKLFLPVTWAHLAVMAGIISQTNTWLASPMMLFIPAGVMSTAASGYRKYKVTTVMIMWQEITTKRICPVSVVLSGAGRFFEIKDWHSYHITPCFNIHLNYSACWSIYNSELQSLCLWTVCVQLTDYIECYLNMTKQ